ncbi:hypothetical protein TWF132_007890 [Orbilia oligospora]|nr:hypothetical protein TWF132_007890 [Orbilia oligospora]
MITVCRKDDFEDLSARWIPVLPCGKYGDCTVLLYPTGRRATRDTFSRGFCHAAIESSQLQIKISPISVLILCICISFDASDGIQHTTKDTRESYLGSTGKRTRSILNFDERFFNFCTASEPRMEPQQKVWLKDSHLHQPLCTPLNPASLLFHAYT